MIDLKNESCTGDSSRLSCAPIEDEPDVIKTRRRGRSKYVAQIDKASTSSLNLSILIIILALDQVAAFALQLDESAASSRLAATGSGAPSQLFLPQAQPISRVSGFYPKKTSDEEEDGFIMQAATSVPRNATSSLDEEPTTTSAPLTTTTTTTTVSIDSGGEASDEGGIAIDVNRQQFLTHDQLNLNASTKDETAAPDLHRVQSSRADRSKVSHVSSFLSDLFQSYATRVRPTQVSSEQDRLEHLPTKSTNSHTKRPSPATTTLATCPGVCRSIVTASFLCHHEINAPCPALFQKCCDTNDVSFNGTPVETSAPLTSTDSTEPNPAPLSEQTAQAQNDNRGASQTTAPATTLGHVSTHSTPAAPTTSATEAAASTTTTTTTQQPSQQRLGSGGDGAGEPSFGQQAFDYLLRGASNQPATLYFLSSSNGSSNGGQQPDQQVEQQHPRPGKNELAQPANDNKQQSSASQSFDPPVNEHAPGKQQTVLVEKMQAIVVQTANGSIVHHHHGQSTNEQLATAKPLQVRTRPAYANWTDYHLSIMQTRPSTGQAVVYHSNIDPVKRFAAADVSSAATLQPLKPQVTTSTTHTTTTTESAAPSCSGVCMRKVHVRSCAAVAGPNPGEQQAPPAELSSEGCSLADEFCCLQSAQVSLGSDQISATRRTMLVPGILDGEQIRGVKVMNDQHSSKTPAITLATTSTSTTTTTSAPSTTSTPAPTITTTEQPAASTSEPIGLFGHVLGELFDSFIGNAHQASSQQPDETQSGHATDQMVSFAESPVRASSDNTNQQNDHRLGYDLSFRQQTPQGSNNRRQQTEETGAPGDLMTSEGDTQPPFASASDQNQVADTCAGYCILPLFSMLCDRAYQSADCGSDKKCCRMTGAAATGSNDDAAPTTTGGLNDQIGASSTAPGGACRGNCLPVYHSSLCTKPNEIDALGCLPNQVCCQPPDHQTAGTTTNQLDDTLDNMMTGASGPIPGLDTKQTTSANSLYVSLLPPPPPPVAQSFAIATSAAAGEHQQPSGDSINGRVPTSSIIEQQTRQRQGHLSIPGEQARVVFTQQPPLTTTSRPAASSKTTAASSTGGFINQIYQMFKSNGSGKQRQKNQPQQVGPQVAHLPSYSFVPQMVDPAGPDAYLVHQYHQMQASSLHPQRAAPVQPQLVYPIQPANNVLLAPAASHFNPLVNNYEMDAVQQQVISANRNNRVQQHGVAATEQQQFVSKHPLVQQQQPQRTYIGQQQQQVHPHAKTIPQYPHNQAMNPMSQFNEQNNQLIISDKFVKPLAQQSAEQKPAIVGFIGAGADGVGTNNLPQQQLAPKPLGNNGNNKPPGQSLTQFSGSQSNNNNERRFHPPQVDNAHLTSSFNQPNRHPQAASYHHQQQQQQHIHQQAAMSPLGIGAGANTKRQLPSIQANGAPVRQQQPLPARLDPQKQQLGGSGAQQLQVTAGQMQHQQQQQQQQRQPATGRPNAVSRPPAGSDQVNGQQPAMVMSSVSRGGVQQPPTQQRLQQSNQVAVAQISGQHLRPHVTQADTPRRQSQWQASAVDDEPSTHLQPAACPASCLAPLLSFNCVKPNYIDHDLLCPTSGAVCCVRGLDQQVSVATSNQPEPHSSGGGSSTTVSMVSNNNLDSSVSPSLTSMSEQDDQMDEMSKQQQSDSASGDSVANSPDLDSAANQQPPIKSSRPATCGVTGPRSRAHSGRVMGGSEARPGHWCWQAPLMNANNEYLCGGALIGSKWVLTASHCVTQQLRSDSQLFVRLGQHNLNSNSADARGRNVLVKTTYVHHNHNGTTLDNDIALLRLEDAADLDDPAICTVCLPERSSQVEPGKRCTVTGYGFEEEDGPAALRVRQADLPIVGEQECQSKLSKGLNSTFNMPANSFCAGGELGQDACHGDGGSPLSCQVDGYYELTGIVSWGYKCGRKDLPGLYSKVSAFVGWINQIVSVNN